MSPQEAPKTEQGKVRYDISQLKDRKGLLSRQIGEAKKAGLACDELISELQQVSSQLKANQKSLKQALNDEATQEVWSPGTPAIPQAILDKPGISGEITDALTDSDVIEKVQSYVRAHPAASIWHLPEVLRFIQRHYGHSCQYLCCMNQNGQVIGVLPVAQLRSRLFGNFMVSVPYFNYGGVLADNADVAASLVKTADEWRSNRNAEHVELRHHSDNGLNLPRRKGKVTFWLPLPEAPDELWRSFQPKVRAQVKRGSNETSELTIGGAELIDEFYRVFARNMRDLGTPVYDKRFFIGLLEALGDRAHLVIARIDGKPVGCAFITGFRDRMEIPWASTLREYNHTGVNMAMYWHILEFAVNQEYRVFDFGRCSRDAGTYRFKQQWGATPVPLHWDYCLAEGSQLPQLNPDNPKFRFMIAAWKRMPVWISKLLGPGIVKHLP
ncbi:FemAB family XrtA/PEP-CTERM system-associated protein [Marinobacter sp. CHS3-4]|uniref:FemAB family XrtA/PEP-CTERM system-associated protein n=1 Tax=Marinobacter sp. CHS3-4 TaxID=3045174 RepID=UPI0024B511DD|nr:FemAB family XrtA/PEP-CTERM system-associated protein [Marinobacter sp. CHS3-4]MDI9245588.1 FemAB family PEP-CTERM system-associated protein [Marinobacter sp. CHS3-4]